MCGIAGFCNFKQSYLEEKPYWETILTQMNTSLSHRGMDDSGVFLLPHTGFSHARLSIRDIKNGGQPMTRRTAPRSVYSIVYNGEIYNTKELASALRSDQHPTFRSHTLIFKKVAKMLTSLIE